MADWGSALTAQLLANAALSALVGDRIDWLAWAESGVDRQVTLQTISDVRPDHYSGSIDHRMTRVQADAWSTISSGDAAAIAEAVIGAVRLDAGDVANAPEGSADRSGAWVRDGVRFDRPQIEGPVDGVEQLDTVRVYRARVDLLLWHCETEGV